MALITNKTVNTLDGYSEASGTYSELKPSSFVNQDNGDMEVHLNVNTYRSESDYSSGKIPCRPIEIKNSYVILYAAAELSSTNPNPQTMHEKLRTEILLDNPSWVEADIVIQFP